MKNLEEGEAQRVDKLQRVDPRGELV